MHLFFGNFQISLVILQHGGYFISLRQREQFVNRAQIFKKIITFFFGFEAEDRFKKMIYGGSLYFLFIINLHSTKISYSRILTY